MITRYNGKKVINEIKNMLIQTGATLMARRCIFCWDTVLTRMCIDSPYRYLVCPANQIVALV